MVGILPTSIIEFSFWELFQRRLILLRVLFFYEGNEDSQDRHNPQMMIISGCQNWSQDIRLFLLSSLVYSQFEGPAWVFLIRLHNGRKKETTASVLKIWLERLESLLGSVLALLSSQTNPDPVIDLLLKFLALKSYILVITKSIVTDLWPRLSWDSKSFSPRQVTETSSHLRKEWAPRTAAVSSIDLLFYHWCHSWLIKWVNNRLTPWLNRRDNQLQEA